MQINVGHLNENGQYDGTFTTIALAGKVRAMVSTALLLVHLVQANAAAGRNTVLYGG